MAMKIDEAISHAREVAKEQRKDNENCKYKAEYGCKGCADYYSKPCIECAEEHEQLAEWLEELKMYKSLSPRELVSEKQKNDRAMEYSKGFDYGFKTGYNKAIDDFAEKVKEMYAFTILQEEHLNEIAEQLKAGVTDAGN